MTVFSLRTDQCLDELARYEATWQREPTGNVWNPQGQPMRVSYRDIDGNSRTCVRLYGVDVLDVWSGKDSHGPYDFNA